MYQTRLLLFLLIAYGSLCTAGVYKWVDENGQVHFGDRPPEGEAQEMQMREDSAATAPPDEAERRERRQRMLEMYQEDREKKKLAEKEAKEEREKRKRQCVLAKDKLRQMESSGALYDLQPDGERRFLSEEERKQAIARARGEVKRQCR